MKRLSIFRKIELIFLICWLITGVTIIFVVLISLPFLIASKIMHFLFG